MRSILPVIAVLMVSACASSGPLYRDASKGYKPVSANAARVIMYREASGFGAGVQPSVMLDNAKVRDSVPGSYTMRDVKPGTHVVTTETEVEKRISLNVPAKKTAYVRESMGFGWLVGRVHLESVDEAQAQQELQELHEIANPTVSEVKE